MAVEPIALQVDRCLVEVSDRLDYLLAVTPLDTEGVWRGFEASGHRRLPKLTYRPLAFDPTEEQARLAGVPVDDIEDPAVASLLGGLRDELVTLCRMVAARETEAFIGLSAEVHGMVGEEALAEAERILEILHGWRADWHEHAVDARAFAEAGRAEVERLRERHPDLDADVEIRDDVHGVMVVRRMLLIDTLAAIDPRRVEALVQHEVGTHVVTEVNGAAQPLASLQVGLAGYEETQEGVAVLAEHATGGLTAERLALLAARVLVVRRRVEEVPFAETVAELVDLHGFSARAAFDVVIRVHRGGGLLKDAVYLRGFGRALEHLRTGGALAPLLIGKVDLGDVAAIEDLLARGVLRAPLVMPRWAERLEASELPEDLDTLAAQLRTDEDDAMRGRAEAGSDGRA
jgi:uncharacterized protein (TIGR02421 family)